MDKKIWFRDSDTSSKAESAAAADDIYLWVSSAPDSSYPMNKAYVRARSLLGLTRIRKNRDGKPGCVYESIVQTDCKLNSWTASLVSKYTPGGLLDWAVILREFAELKSKQAK